jgi:hypothetical protein
MLANHPAHWVAAIAAAIVAVTTWSTPTDARAGPLRKAAAGAKAAGRFVAHAIPGHARRAERRQAQMIGLYIAPAATQPALTSTPIGETIPAVQQPAARPAPRCIGEICPYARQ